MHRINFRQFATAAALVALAAFLWTFAPYRALATGDAEVPSSAYATLDDALLDGMTNIALNQNDTLLAASLDHVVINIGNGYTLSVNNAVLDGGALTGGTVAGNVYLNSDAAVTSNCTGTVFIPLTLPTGVPAGATVLFSDGSSDDDGDAWYDRSKTISGFASGGITYSDSGERIYRISYKDETGKQLSAGKQNPSTYTASSGTVTIHALSDLPDYTFKGWYCDTIDVNNYIPNYTFSAAGVSSDLVFTAAYEEMQGSASGAGMIGSARGSSGGGGSAGGNAAAVTVSATAETEVADETAQTPTTAPGDTGGMRVQAASSRTKSTLTKTSAADGGLTIESFQSKQDFPWEWLAACALLAGGAALFFVFIKRRADERTAAMYEKLHIRD